MYISAVKHLFNELDNDEVIRIELINGNKIYCLPSDSFILGTTTIKIIKPINENKLQQILIDLNSIVIVCTMSRQTYEAKLKRGELYV